MNLPAAAVRRPIFTSMVTLIVIVLGGMSLARLRIDLFPEIELPSLSIRTEYEGASPEVVEKSVTEVIEEIVATVPGVHEIVSTSAEGASVVRVRFVWGTNLDAAADDVQARLESEADELPETVSRPQIRKFDLSSYPVVILGIAGALDPVELTELIDQRIRYRFARLPGVAQVDIFGGYEREIRVELDPGRIRALGLPLDRILAALRDANLDLPAGEIARGRHQVTLRAPAEFTDLDEIRRTVVDVRDGAPVTLGQVAEVKDTHARITRIVRVNGEPGIRVGIRKQADANTVEVSRAILEEVRRVNADFPQVRVVPVVNQGNFIERSITNVAHSVLAGGALAVLVLLFFLLSVRSTVVIALSIPISVIATFALIYFGGFTLNLMTLGGLALGVGMMVDSSIVVLENIFRRREEEGEGREEAAVRGTGEVAAAVVASTVTTLVIFLPLVFVRGVTGILFKEMALVIVFSLVCSLFVALTVVPMLASRLLAARGAGGPGGRLAGGARRLFRRLEAAYEALLARALRRRWMTVGIAAGALGGSLLLLPLIGTEFMPPSDEGEVRVTGEMEVGTRLELVDEQTRRMEEIVFPAVPERAGSVVSVGGSGGDAFRGEIALTLTPAAERTRSNVEVADALRERLEGRVPGMTIRVRAPQGQFLLDRLVGGGEGLEIEVRGQELEVLEALAARAAEVVSRVPGVTDVEIDRRQGVPQDLLRIDRDKAADLGLSARQVAEALETAVAGRRAGDYRARGHSYRILVQLAGAERLALDEILDLTLTSRSGEDVALRNVLRVEEGTGPLVIERKDQQRTVTVSANVSGRPTGSAAVDVERALAAIPRPEGYELRVTGDFEEQRKAFAELIVSLALAVVLVYMVLACQYESLRDPLVVMFSVPMSAVGVLPVLFFTGTTLNVQSLTGCVMLGGIVVNNAILLVDQAERLRREGRSAREAAAEAGRRRLRPILMTTLTTILGLAPLAAGVGEGADAQAPLARAVLGGLTGSTVLTLVLIPAVYTMFHPDRRAQDGGWLGR
ncbi:MAG TPA: efflux RND transporter permease subunit [Planctomycetota bacterium]|nr:efflux RND transporter permease subunit [Planctomycetota bacterium]